MEDFARSAEIKETKEMKIFIILALLIPHVYASPLLSCYDEGISFGKEDFDINLELYQETPIAYAATLTLSQHGNIAMIIKQQGLSLWSTYGAEVLNGKGAYTIQRKPGNSESFDGLTTVISRMLTPERVGLVSVSLKFLDPSGKISYISRSCK